MFYTYAILENKVKIQHNLKNYSLNKDIGLEMEIKA